MDIFSVVYKSAGIGNWIKDSFQRDRSVGLVQEIDSETNMMSVHYPKIGKNAWVVWKNNGHYKVI